MKKIQIFPRTLSRTKITNLEVRCISAQLAQVFCISISDAIRKKHLCLKFLFFFREKNTQKVFFSYEILVQKKLQVNCSINR